MSTKRDVKLCFGFTIKSSTESLWLRTRQSENYVMSRMRIDGGWSGRFRMDNLPSLEVLKRYETQLNGLHSMLHMRQDYFKDY